MSSEGLWDIKQIHYVKVLRKLSSGLLLLEHIKVYKEDAQLAQFQSVVWSTVLKEVFWIIFCQSQKES